MKTIFAFLAIIAVVASETNVDEDSMILNEFLTDEDLEYYSQLSNSIIKQMEKDVERIRDGMAYIKIAVTDLPSGSSE